MPEISVLTSVYNCEDYIEEFLDSILNQTFNDFELIIVNDGSTDKSEEIIKKYRDDRIKLYNLGENLGIPEALNFGIDKCTGKYIAKADADDVYTLDRLEKQKEVLDKNEDIVVVGSYIEYFPHDEESKKGLKYNSKKQYFERQLNSIHTYKDLEQKMYMFLCIIHSVMMIRKDVLLRYKYDKEFYPIGEDYKLLYDLNRDGYRMVNIPEKLGKIRIRTNSTSVENKNKLYEAFFKIKKQEIDKIFDSPVYVWGAGGYGVGIKKEAEKNGYKISGFIDKDKEKIGSRLENLDIYSPDVLKEKKAKVISASDPGRFEIVDHLKKLGYEHLEDFIVF